MKEMRMMTRPEGEVAWDDSDTYYYVACCYGPEGDEPGDCHVRVGEDEGGQWWVDDGDETVRCDTYGPYATEDEARQAATDLAAELDESEDDDEDAEGMRERLLTERAGSPDPDGDYALYWETVGDDAHAVERYATLESAEAAARLANDALHRSHPGGRLLCGYDVRVLDEGQWVCCDGEV